MNASKGFLLVLVSIALHLSNGESDVTTIDILGDSEQKSLAFKITDEKVISCKLTRPNGTIVNEDEDVDDFAFKKPCTFTPKQYWDVNLSGTYVLTLTHEVDKKEEDKKTEDKSQTFHVNWMKSVKVTPESVNIFSKQTLTLHMLQLNDEFSKFKSCEYKKDSLDEEPIEDTEKEEEKNNDDKKDEEKDAKDENTIDEKPEKNEKPGAYITMKEGHGTITDDGLCQVVLNNIDSAEHDGFWELITTTERGHRLKAIFQISVIDEKQLEKITEKNLLVSSANNKIETTVDIANTLHCSLYDNYNKLVAADFGPCFYKIKDVRKYNEGKWKAKLLLEGRVEAFEQTLNVKVFVQGKQTQCNNVKGTKRINMMCECNSAQSSKCLFSGPSEQVISLTEGIGNSKYSFYSNFKDSTGKQQCGLTIDAVDKKDEGAWKCQIENTCNHFIQVSAEKGCIEPDQNVEYVPMAPETFYVIQNVESEGLTCSINSELQYCFFHTTEGIEIAGDTTSGTAGLCTMPSFKYNTNHTGTWKCVLGVATQAKEYTQDIDVQVLSSWFQPAKDEFVYEQKVGVDIKCLNHDPENTEVLICRFVRPDGQIIKLEAGGKDSYYESTSQPSHGVCGLKLNDLKKEDAGNWQCTAMVLKDNARVLYNKNFLVSSASMFHVSLQLVTLVSIILTWWHR